jgi:hypothetical protein
MGWDGIVLGGRGWWPWVTLKDVRPIRHGSALITRDQKCHNGIMTCCCHDGPNGITTASRLAPGMLWTAFGTCLLSTSFISHPAPPHAAAMSSSERIRNVQVHRPVIYGSQSRLLSDAEKALAPPGRESTNALSH